MPDETRVRIHSAEELDAALTRYDEDICGDLLALHFADLKYLKPALQDVLSIIPYAPAPSRPRAALSQATDSSKERTVLDKDWFMSKKSA